MVKLRVFLLLSLLSMVLVVPGQAAFEQEKHRFYQLLAEGSYLSAGQYLVDRKKLLNEPFFIREYTHLLVDKYITTSNFTLFSLKDLKIGEEVEELRGNTLDSVIVGGSLEEFLYTRLKKFPESPEVNFAVAEYISKGRASGLYQMPKYFNAEEGDEFRYLVKSYNGGVFDYWSLFRLGTHYQRDQSSGGSSQDKAISFYKKSLGLNPEHTASKYNLAVAYFQKGDDISAEKYAEKALAKYDNDSLNADTYLLYARIMQVRGATRDAEYSYERAISLRKWDDEAFVSLLTIYRQTNRKEKYLKLVTNYISIDYSNNFLFDNYFVFISNQGITAWDKELIRTLVDRKYEKKAEEGAIFYNLGRFAEITGAGQKALKWYQKALDIFMADPEPPDGAIAALGRLIENLNKKND